MARGSSNPMQEHHKKQRQKQVQKNKQQRTKARDERVVKEKTVASVKEEIRALEKRGKHHKLQAAEEQKLQRLKKELKLVQEAAQAAKAAQAEQPRYQQKQRPLTELDDPRKSVYYDAQFNPYGAAPPGKPRLYHQRGGGVTMDIRMAVVPGEEEPPPPPPPPPPTESRQHRPTQSRQAPYQPQSASSSSTTPKFSRQLQKNDKLPPKEASSSKNTKQETPAEKAEETATESKISTESSENDAKQPAKAKPLAIPSLPAASQAVQRTQRRRKQEGMVDIWASNEEVEYERQVNNIDVEADDIGSSLKTKKKAKKKKVPLEYFYRDQAGQVQGPFDKSQMMGWMEAGYFPLETTMIKTTRNKEWVSMVEVPSLQQQPQQTEKSSMEDRIAALKRRGALQEEEDEEAMSVQARIAALKGGPVPDDEHDGGNADTLSLQSRIAFLKPPPQQHVEDEDTTEVGNESSVQDRIALLRGQAPPANASDDNTDEGGTAEMADAAPYPEPAEDEEAVAPYPVAEEEDGVAAYLVAPYPAGEVDTDEGYPIAPYPVAENDNDGDMAYPVAPYPVDQGNDGNMAVAVYPTEYGDANRAIADYPIDVTYPTDDDLAYPVTDAYPTGEETDNGATDANPPPGAGAVVATEETAMNAPKKRIKVDSALVAFLPSHLQAKKRKAKEQSHVPAESTVPSPPLKQPRNSAVTTSADNKKESEDDLNKFMDEIDGL